MHKDRRAKLTSGNPDRDCVLEGECRPRHASRKSTARWCKGKVGREHEWVWVNEQTLSNTSRHPRFHPAVERQTQVCTRCKKQKLWLKRRRIHVRCGGLFEKCGEIRHRVPWTDKWGVVHAGWEHIERVHQCDTCKAKVIDNGGF